MQRTHLLQIPNSNKASKWILLLVCVLLIKVYADNRNLFLDEQNLASNLAERSYTGLAHALSYEQAAPPLFLMASKALGQVLGMWDWVLRLIPLLAGVLSILLFRAVLLRHFDHYEVLLALLLLGLSPLFVMYATECKQYMTDVLFAVGCLYVAEKLQPGTKPKHWLLWALLGCVGIWMSMPAVFVLCGVGAYYMWPLKPLNKGHLRILLLGLVWVLCFLAYWQVLSASAQDDHFLRAHADFILGMHLGEFKFLGILAQTFADMCMRCNGFLIPACFAGFFLVGSVVLLRQKTALGCLLLVPIAATLLASLLNSYSLMARLTLFMMPAYLFICCAGIAHLNAWARARGALMGALGWVVPTGLCLAIVIPYSALPYLYTPYPSVQAQEGLAALKAQMHPTDVVFFTQFGQDAYRYYGQHYAKPIQLSGETNTLIKPYLFERLPVVVDSLRQQHPGRRIVLYDSHTWGEELAHLRYLTRVHGAHTCIDQGSTRAYIFPAKP